MLSYQHAYHAGNAADLHKHIVLARLLEHLTAKPRGITYLETHAGRALYDLNSPESLKTGEAERGIARLATDPASPYDRALAAIRRRHGPSAYAGSPLIARTLLRQQDRLILCELHPAEHAALRRVMLPHPDEAPAAIHRRDGWEGILALLPPDPRRGLLLIDPAYEVKSEYEFAGAAVRRIVGKWPQGIVLVWYPILAAGRHEALVAALRPLRFVRDEVAIVGAEGGMAGSGLLLVNPPHGGARAFSEAHSRLSGILRPVGIGR
jgi:23S rRNA (adenine2030-N6)-methyltransferase